MRSHRRPHARVLAPLAVLAFVLISLVLAHSDDVTTEPGNRTVDSVVIFAVPNIGIDDVRPGVMPVLNRLAERGAIGATNVRTGDKPSLLDAYASLGAATRTHVPPTPAIEPDLAPVPLPLTASPSPDGPPGLIVPQMPTLVERAEGGATAAGRPGSLATALGRARRKTALVTNAGIALSGPEGTPAPAAATAADPAGRVDRGSVADSLLRADLRAPFGIEADPSEFATAVTQALWGADVVVVDTGDANRTAASAAGNSGDQTPTEGARLAALARSDEVLGQVAKGLDANTLLLVVGVTPPGSRWALTPMVATGAGVPHGYLYSSSTHRSDLVTLTDVAPTILNAFGIDVPAAMAGNPLVYRPGKADWAGASSLDNLLERRAPIDKPMAIGFIVVQTLVYLLAIGVLILRPRRPAWVDGALLAVVLTCGSWPLATFLLRVAPSLYTLGAGTFVLTWVIAGGVAWAVYRLRAHPLDPVLALCALTVATLVADLATGARLQYGSFFGYAPNTAPRFTGIGNAAFALLGGATIALSAAIMARAKDKTEALWVVGAISAIVVLADGAPWMGADVGGILTLVPVLCLMIWALSGHPVRWHTIGLAVLAAAAVLGFAVAIEAMRAPEQRTHVGRFFLRSDDQNLVRSTLARKWSTNTQVLRRSPFAWLVPVMAGGALAALVRGRAWKRVLPLGSPERIGVTATLGLGFAGWLLNDSGVVVVALTAVFLGPFILLLAQAADVDRPQGAMAGTGAGEPVEMEETSNVTERMSSEAAGEAQPTRPEGPVVAIVPAKDRADSVGATVSALLGLSSIDRILVVDDGSTDATVEMAAAAGADVLRLATNIGKGGAVAEGVRATPDAAVYLLIDADLATTAAAADLLLEPVLSGQVDLAVGVLPSAEGRGGFGLVRDFARNGIRRACGTTVRAPLSGQRAVRAELLRDLADADRFGLEVAMTVDVVRAGGRILEVEVPMDHRHTGRSLAGFAHRARQGRDIARSLWPRLTSRRQRIASVVVATLLIAALAAISGTRQAPSTVALGAEHSKVLVFGMEPFDFDDLSPTRTPNLQRLVDEGSLGALSVRTVGRRPTAAEGYLAVGAGARLRSAAQADVAVDRGETVAGMTAADYVGALTGVAPQGQVVVLGGPAVSRRNQGPDAAGEPGTLGTTLRKAGMSAAVVGSSDQPATYDTDPDRSRPAALAVMASDFGVDRARIDPSQVLETNPSAPYGTESNADAIVKATMEELDRSELVVVDPGDLTRAERFGRAALAPARSVQWDRALTRTDDTLGRIVDQVDNDTLVLVVSVAPRGGELRPTPLVAWGAGVPHGTITSPSTQRHGVSAITDLAPTIIDALGLPVSVDLPGHAVRYEPGRVDPGALRSIDADTVVRERTYGPTSKAFIWTFTALYLLALFVVSSRPRFTRLAPWFRLAMLSVAAFPVATFLVRLLPGLTTWFVEAQALAAMAVSLAIALLAGRDRRSALSSFSWVVGLTLLVVLVDTWTGTKLEMSSWLGYSVHSPGRFYGVPNTTFAVMGACSLLYAGMLIDRSPRRSEAVVKAACIFFLVLVSAGLPMLGADVGTLITLFPVYVVLLLFLSGRKIKVRTLVLAGLAMVALVALAAGLDLARPAADRSHLGQFAEKLIHDGPSALTDTINRKEAANLRILQGSVWSRLLPVAGLFLFIPLVWERRYREILPPGSAVRAAFWAVLAASGLGFLANDSGPIVISLFVAYLPPLIGLLILQPPPGPPELVPAETGPR